MKIWFYIKIFKMFPSIKMPMTQYVNQKRLIDGADKAMKRLGT